MKQEIAQGDAILDLLVTSEGEELMMCVRIGGSLGCSHHAPVEFTVLKNTNQSRNILRTPKLRTANFQLFSELVTRTLWEMALKDKRPEQS